jgi:acetoin utilization protein AcuC
MVFNLVYHPKYLDYKFGVNHPFQPERALKFLKLLEREKIKFNLSRPKPVGDEDVLLVHSLDYLKRLKYLANIKGELSPDTPVNQNNLRSAYYYVGGTMLAAKLALEKKTGINLLGGLHHAGIGESSGFCLFNDHAIVIRKLQKAKKIKTAFVFDIDVHAGQGTQEIFYQDPSVYTLSIHQDPATIYPGTGFQYQTGTGAGKGYNRNILLAPGTHEQEYLQALEKGIRIHRDFQPDITFLVFGADTYKEDPLANIKLNLDSYKKIGALFKNINCLCLLFAGGYSLKVPIIWRNLLLGLTSN